MTRRGRLAGAVFSMEIRRMFAYRTDFWIQFAGSFLAQFVVAFFLWRSIFVLRGADAIGSYTFRGMMLYYLLVPIIGRATRGVSMGNLAHDIYEGTLTRYLIYPVSVLGFKFMTHLAYTAVFLAQGVALMLLYYALFGAGGETVAGPAEIAMGLAAVLVATALHFIMISAIELTAFWADNVWSLVAIVHFITGLLGGGMLPLELFPDRMQAVMEWLPFAYLYNFPARCLMGRVAVGEWATGMSTAIAWGLLLAVVYAAVWRRGMFKYTGVGI